MIPHYVAEGPADAPVLVLGPSVGTDLNLFAPQVAALGDRYRIVRFDLRGHGGSPTPDGPYTIADLAGDVLELIDSLGVQRFHYAGVSLGGAIGLWLAVHHGDRLLSVTVCASSARFADPASWPARAATVRAEGTEALVASRAGTWFTRRFAETRPAEVERLLEMLRHTSDEGYAGCCEAIGSFDLRDELARVHVPTLAVAGEEDPATPPEMLRHVAESVQHGRLVVVPGAAHLVTAESPDAVNGPLAAHLAHPEVPTDRGETHD